MLLSLATYSMSICSSGSRLVFLVHVLLVQCWKTTSPVGFMIPLTVNVSPNYLVSFLSLISVKYACQYCYSSFQNIVLRYTICFCFLAPFSLFFPLPPLICTYLSLSLASTGTLSKHETIVFCGKATPLF